jgi:hypothetical protein
LPRLEDGFYLNIIKRRLDSRAGISLPPESIGPFHGFVDEAGPSIVRGWAQSVAAPEEPVLLKVWVSGRCVANVIANHYRPDLRAAGLGSGCHGFLLLLPPGLTGPIEISYTSDGAYLPLSEAAISRTA